MAIAKHERYRPPHLLFNRHLETIYPALFRKIEHNGHVPLSIKTVDDDFLELDWYKGYSQQNVVIICHGLEGDSVRPYMKGMARAFNLGGWDAIAWNYRGCGRKMNLKKIYYHSGATYDLEEVVNFAQKKYTRIFLAGFSLGGNLVLKYLGERPRKNILGAAVFSVPMDLYGCSREMEKQHNQLYSRRFLRNLKKKVVAKRSLLHDEYPLAQLQKVKTLYEFDELFTAPLHGFKDARDYYDKCSSLHFIKNIQAPTLIVNARNDPFLTPDCFPESETKNHGNVYLEITAKGGHVGFSVFNQPVYWSEQRAVDFASNLGDL